MVGAADAGPAALLATARRLAPGGSVIVAGEPDAPGVPLLADRPLVDGGPAAYVCRGFVCDRPVTTPEDLARALSPPGTSRRAMIVAMFCSPRSPSGSSARSP